MRKKNTIKEVTVQKMQFPNEGIAYVDDKEVFIKNGLIGQKLLIKIVRKKRLLRGIVLEIVEKSPKETSPFCDDFNNCGGCTFQNIPYTTELTIKESNTLNIINYLGVDYIYDGIEKAPNYREYRNKMEYSFGDDGINGKLALGMRKRNSYYEVVTAKECNIVDADYRGILNEVLKFFKNSDETFYHKTKHTGTLRHLIIRKGFFTNELTINLVTKNDIKHTLSNLVTNLLKLNLNGKIIGIYQTVNNNLSDTVICDNFYILHGQEFFTEKLLGLYFKISPFAFFQTNSAGAEKLYTTVKDYIGDAKDKIIFDLYCGTGTISQIVSEKAKKVIGVEIIEEAIINANMNAKLNNISNCEFINGDVLNIINTLEIKPDIIILDPPRDGIHSKAINKIIDFDAKKIVYISCKPTSLYRDLEIFLKNGYILERLKIHDMFPRTYHVETVALLSKLKSADTIDVEIELKDMDRIWT